MPWSTRPSGPQGAGRTTGRAPVNYSYGAGQTNGVALGSAPWPWFFLAIDETHWP
jgi:hypothetical protein